MLKSQGMQPNQQVDFLSDGGEDVRNVQLYLNPQAKHLLDLFHLTMRLTAYNHTAKGLPESGFVETAINKVVSKRMLKKQQNGMEPARGKSPADKKNPRPRRGVGETPSGTGIRISALERKPSSQRYTPRPVTSLITTTITTITKIR
jgi:hypothetical protein